MTDAPSSATAICPATCREARGALSRHLDDRLDEPARARIDAHLAACDECAHTRRVLERTGMVLSRGGPAPVPTDLAERALRAAFSADAEQAARTGFIHRWIEIAWPAALVASTATAALLFFALPAGDNQARDNQSSAGERSQSVQTHTDLGADPIALLAPLETEPTSSASDGDVSGDDPLYSLLPVEDR